MENYLEYTKVFKVLGDPKRAILVQVADNDLIILVAFVPIVRNQISEIYQKGMDTNLTTFQTECPTYEEFDQSHMEQCRLVITDDTTIVGWAALSPVSSRCVYRGVAEVLEHAENEIVVIDTAPTGHTLKQLYSIDMEKTQQSTLLSEIPPVDIVVIMGGNVTCPFLPCKHRPGVLFI